MVHPTQTSTTSTSRGPILRLFPLEAILVFHGFAILLLWGCTAPQHSQRDPSLAPGAQSALQEAAPASPASDDPSGSHEALQAYRLLDIKEDLADAARYFRVYQGRWPVSWDELDGTLKFPFELVSADGTPLPWQDVKEGELQPGLYLTFESDGILAEIASAIPGEAPQTMRLDYESLQEKVRRSLGRVEPGGVSAGASFWRTPCTTFERQLTYRLMNYAMAQEKLPALMSELSTVTGWRVRPDFPYQLTVWKSDDIYWCECQPLTGGGAQVHRQATRIRLWNTDTGNFAVGQETVSDLWDEVEQHRPRMEVFLQHSPAPATPQEGQ